MFTDLHLYLGVLYQLCLRQNKNKLNINISFQMAIGTWIRSEFGVSIFTVWMQYLKYYLWQLHLKLLPMAALLLLSHIKYNDNTRKWNSLKFAKSKYLCIFHTQTYTCHQHTQLKWKCTVKLSCMGRFFRARLHARLALPLMYFIDKTI